MPRNAHLQIEHAKIDAFVWLTNYRSTHRPAYLTYAIRATAEALALYRQSKGVHHV